MAAPTDQTTITSRFENLLSLAHVLAKQSSDISHRLIGPTPQPNEKNDDRLQATHITAQLQTLSEILSSVERTNASTLDNL